MGYWWIDINGKLIEVDKLGHNDYAMEVLLSEMHRLDIFEYLEENNCNSAYQILHKRGWVRASETCKGKIRIMGDCISYVKVMRNTINPAMNIEQLKTAKKLCKDFNTDFLDSINGLSYWRKNEKI